MSYTKKQHYISKYILNRFADKKGKVEAILIKAKPQRIKSHIDDICCQNNFYEAFDKKGNFIRRNRAENKFAKIETKLALYVDKLLNILSLENRAIEIQKMMEGYEYEELTVWMMFHLTLILNRLPQVKNIAFKNDIPKEIGALLYELIIWGTVEANDLAINLFEGEELNIVQQVLEKDNDEYTGGINVLLNFDIETT